MSWQGRANSGNAGDWVLGVSRKPSKSQAVDSGICGQRMCVEAAWLADGWTIPQVVLECLRLVTSSVFIRGSGLGPGERRAFRTSRCQYPSSHRPSPYISFLPRSSEPSPLFAENNDLTSASGRLHAHRAVSPGGQVTRQDFMITCLFSLVCGTTSQFCPVHRFLDSCNPVSSQNPPK